MQTPAQRNSQDQNLTTPETNSCNFYFGETNVFTCFIERSVQYAKKISGQQLD
jgi:hypothetical protein